MKCGDGGDGGVVHDGGAANGGNGGNGGRLNADCGSPWWPWELVLAGGSANGGNGGQDFGNGGNGGTALSGGELMVRTAIMMETVGTEV